jgi:hypothetical protein
MHNKKGLQNIAIMGSCMSSPKVAMSSFDDVYVNAMTIPHVSTHEVDELIERMADELVLEMKTKMPSVPKNKVAVQ